MHRDLTELFRLSDSLANQSFCLSDILRVQLNFKRTLGKRLLTSDELQFDNAG